MTQLSMPAPTRPAPRTKPLAVWIGGNMPVARIGLILNLLVPLALLVYDARQQKLGVNAVNFAIHTTGIIAVVCLLLSLCVTPLRLVTSWSWLIQFRRSLGVYAFYYASAHLAIYFWWDRQRSLSSTVSEITHRYYLTIGFASLALMAPLWATSFDRAIRAMGGVWWKRLHRLAYLAAALACYHYYLQVKADKRIPELFIAVLAGLLLWRVVAAVVRYVKTPARPVTAAGTKARNWRGDLRVVGMFRETPSVRTFRLAPAFGGAVPFEFRAGQFLNLSLKLDKSPSARPVSRSYTIASPPTRDGYIELTIKREENGQVSRHLHDMLMTGETIAVSAPAGRFTFDPGTEPGVTLVAGGVGITPVMSILRDLTDRCWPGKIDLIFSTRTHADIIFADELRLLSSRHPNLHVHHTLTGDVPADWTGSRGRISADMLKRLIPDLTARPAFVCGPDAMATAVREELQKAGVPAARVMLESFTPAKAAPRVMPSERTADAATATVTFSTSNQTASLTPGKTILEAAEEVGVSIDYQCRSGVCGTCRCKLVSGQVAMDTRDALSDADEADGYILACQARATEDVTVEA